MDFNLTVTAFSDATSNAADAIERFGLVMRQHIDSAVEKLAPVQRAEYEHLVADGMPLLDALRIAAKPGRWSRAR